LAIGIAADVAVYASRRPMKRSSHWASSAIALLVFWLVYPLWHRVRFS